VLVSSHASFRARVDGLIAMGAFANVKGLAFYRDNNDDPYITLKEVCLSSHSYSLMLIMTGRRRDRP
jgi:hypothetical protein